MARLVVRSDFNDGRAGEAHRALDGDPEQLGVGACGEGEGEGVADGDDDPPPTTE